MPRRYTSDWRRADEAGSPEGQAAPRGFVCRECGCRHFEVLYTEDLVDGRKRRRRACRNCGRRITTQEREVGDANAAKHEPGDAPDDA